MLGDYASRYTSPMSRIIIANMRNLTVAREVVNLCENKFCNATN